MHKDRKHLIALLFLIYLGSCSADWLMQDNGPLHWKYTTNDQGVKVSKSKKLELENQSKYMYYGHYMVVSNGIVCEHLFGIFLV